MDNVTILTSKGPLTLEQALDSDLDMIPTLTNFQKAANSKRQLEERRSQIVDLIARHLAIPSSDFVVSVPSAWISGSFNVCVPVFIQNPRHFGRLPRSLIFRVAVPSNCGESFNPMIVDEKVRCEAATYIWLRGNCATVPIPRLLGMGFPGMQSFTAIENESFWHRLVWWLRRGMAWLHGDILAPYFPHNRDTLSNFGYLLIERVEHGRMLSSTWNQHFHDERRRSNLYHGLARIMVNLARVPLPRIGSWTLNDHGMLSLTNRPFSDLTVFWSRGSVPTDIPRNMTYTSTEPFIHDLLTEQDNRMRYQPNSIQSKDDGIDQLSLLTALRALVSQYWNLQSRNGPFVLTLLDMHRSNIFVDEDWNITRLIDLEFAPVRPLQMMQVPPWLNGKGVDQLQGQSLDEYKALFDEFVEIVREEEAKSRHESKLSDQLRENWVTGRFWYCLALDSINAFPAIFEQHLQPKYFETFNSETDGVSLARLWTENVFDFIAVKLQDLERYEERIRNIYAEAKSDRVDEK